MRRAEWIVLAFAPLGETVEPAALADGANLVTPPGQDLVRLGLVAHIPDQPVARCVEHIMQRHGEFDDAEAAAEMAASFRRGRDDFGPELGSDAGQILP